ncbi:hypothetical protein B0T22DRAFT_436155 [Podospora appendiculata]|uniref:AMP-activated protein kinase glycogen-binding domain-containing protein n=1 Tax=Podospora appendiculata TaxID=314037 RepID=A0AAE1CFR6_9PEZI|nr:hypothetical protein B0T22DRAFT_436155 [Podospora appendiculata]
MASPKVAATITYQKPGTQPPLFVAGTFSDPPWEAYEMDYTTDANGEHIFNKEIWGKPGSKVHYKFRVGTGDWWVLNDDDTPTATDAMGNRNHELQVPFPEQSANGAPVIGGEEKLAASHGVESKKSTNGDAVAPKPALSPANAAKEILGRSDPHSGSSTPTFARTAAEVADSAALLNKEEPEAPIPDDEAGRIGFRRMSSTPISEVAKTAAEVADSAQTLDNDEAIVEPEDPPHTGPKVEIHKPEDDVQADQPEHGDHRPPLFAHEAVGMYDTEAVEVPSENEAEEKPADETPGKDYNADSIDVNDPTLEPFPSSRDEIIDTVRKLETGLDEDRVAFEGAPLSPVFGSLRPGSEDIAGDVFLAPPVMASPVVPRPTRHLEVPRSPLSSAHSSSLSLQSISEAEDEAEDEGEQPSGPEASRFPPAILLAPPHKKTRSTLKPPTTDEDEGIAWKEIISPGTPTPEDEAKADGSAKTEGTLTPADPPEPEDDILKTRGQLTLENAAKAEDTPTLEDSGHLGKQDVAASERDLSQVLRDTAALEASEFPAWNRPSEPENAGRPAQEQKAPETTEPEETSRGESQSPRIVADLADEAEDSSSHIKTNGGIRNTEAEAGADADADATEATDSGVSDVGASTAVENGHSGEIRKRAGQPEAGHGESSQGERPSTPASMHSTGVKGDRGGNWFRAFVRLLFVDLIGGFLSRLCGNRRQT